MFTTLRRVASAFVFASALMAQTAPVSSLSLSSASAAPGQIVSLNLALSSQSGQLPASLEWTVTYPSSSVTSVYFGGMLGVTGKSGTCVTGIASGIGTFTCILNGPNRDALPAGAIAMLQVALSAGAAGSVNIGLTNALGASPNADAVQITTTGGTISLLSNPLAVPSINSLVCTPAVLVAGAQTSCTVTISTQATTDTAVSILSSSSVFRVPAVVVVPAGATNVTFTGTAAMTSTSQPVTLSAVLSSSVQRTGLTVGASNPTPILSSLAPGSATVGGGDFLLTVSGSNFVSTSVVQWNNAARPTTFVNANLLTATITAADIAVAGMSLVTVDTPAPGGGISGGLSFPVTSPAPLISQVQNGASFAPGPVAPGSFVAITGSNLADNETQSNLTPLPTVLSDVSVSVNNVAIPLKGINPNQINAQLPWDLLPAGATSGSAEVVLTNSAGRSAPLKIQLTSAAPGIFYALTDSGGVQRPAAVNGSDGSLPLPANITYSGYVSRPASVNDPAGIIVFATGLGAVTNQPSNGAPGLGVPPYSTTLETPVVLVGGVPAQVVFSGLSPQFPGVYQLNVILQPGTPTGDAVPVQIQLNGITTTDQLKIAVSN